MLYRHKVIAVIGIVFLLSIIYIIRLLAIETWLSPEKVSIQIVISNQTNESVGPFDISDSRNSVVLHVNKIESFSVKSVYYKMPESWGESAIKITDVNSNDNYFLVPYFENQQKGRIDIQIHCVSPNGLSGNKRDLTSWYFSFEWDAWGKSDCI